MEINSNPSYVYNIKNQNAQVAGSITAETIEENLFTNITQELENQGITEDSKIGDINFASLFANIFASLPTIFENLFNKTSNQQEKADTNANKIKDLEARKSELEAEKQKVTDTYFEKVTNMDSNGMFYMDDDAAAVEEYQTNMANINAELSNIESQIRQLYTQENTPSAEPAPEELQYKLESDTTQVTEIENVLTYAQQPVTNNNTVKIEAEIDILNQQKWELNADKKLNEYKYSQKLNDRDKSNDAAAEAQYQYESMNITTKEFQINHQLELLNNALNAAKQTSDNPQVQELLDKKAELLNKKADITKDYTSALNDKTLTFEYRDVANKDSISIMEMELTYENFCAMPDSQYRLVNPKTGKILCLNANEAENYNTSTNNMEVVPDLKNKAYFQELLQSGQVIIEKADRFNEFWESVDFNSIPNIKTAYNTENDAAAEANYQFQLLQIESELAKVDMELKNAQATAPSPIFTDTLQSGLQDGSLQVTKTENSFPLTEQPVTNNNTAKIQAEFDELKKQQIELELKKHEVSNDYIIAMSDDNTSNDAAAEAQYQYESMNITTKEFQINHQLELLNNALNAAKQTSDNPQVQELLDKKAELLNKKADITKDYTSALNDKTLTFEYRDVANKDSISIMEMELTYENFCAMPDSQYRLVNPKTGKILCLNANEAENYNTSTNNMEVVPDLKNKAYFQELLQSGQVVIQKKEQFGANQTWNAVPFKSIPDIKTAYNTENDAAAEANYQFQLLQIESELAKVDMELKNAQATAPNTIPADTLQSGLQDGTMQVTNTGNGFTITETNTQTETVQSDKQNYVERQVERYEKYIAKYEKQIEILESGNDSNKEAKIASLEQKIEKYMSKIQELID